ncbi:hypothetical protein B0H17DRAFT_1132834 [Mycena rosella]|uniref:Uncharacterized protein n=1 Tax=Mycena rosella TaxID=1033263 RepID=A0AAD7DIY9_MYCRO|nr:hypothetical protein B0H17DRAFT_1132834 [Mycena rosella]
MYVGGRPYSILKVAGAKVKVQWELDESYKKCQRRVPDQDIPLFGWGGTVAAGLMRMTLMVIWGAACRRSDGRTRGGCQKRTWRVRIMSDGGAKQPRIMSDGGAKQPRIMSDGGARQPRYGIRFKRTGQASGAHMARYVHLGSCMMAGQACNHTTHIGIS